MRTTNARMVGGKADGTKMISSWLKGGSLGVSEIYVRGILLCDHPWGGLPLLWDNVRTGRSQFTPKSILYVISYPSRRLFFNQKKDIVGMSCTKRRKKIRKSFAC